MSEIIEHLRIMIELYFIFYNFSSITLILYYDEFIILPIFPLLFLLI